MTSCAPVPRQRRRDERLQAVTSSEDVPDVAGESDSMGLLAGLDIDRRPVRPHQVFGLSYSESRRSSVSPSAPSGRGWHEPADLIEQIGASHDFTGGPNP